MTFSFTGLLNSHRRGHVDHNLDVFLACRAPPWLAALRADHALDEPDRVALGQGLGSLFST